MMQCKTWRLLPLVLSILGMIALMTVLYGSLCTPYAVEKLRVRSPDDRMDAVVVMVSRGGATTKSYYELFVTPLDQPARAGAFVMRASRTSGALSWDGPQKLNVSLIGRTRIDRFLAQVEPALGDFIRISLNVEYLPDFTHGWRVLAERESPTADGIDLR
jgi:hypothetical protein